MRRVFQLYVTVGFLFIWCVVVFILLNRQPHDSIPAFLSSRHSLNYPDKTGNNVKRGKRREAASPWRHQHKRILDQLNSNPPRRKKLVRIYAPSEAWSFGKDEENFKGCLVKNCHVTTDIQYDTSQFDAVVLRGANQIERNLLERRPVGQVWIWFNLEGPRGTCLPDWLDGDVVNWTATYRLDSSIPVPYGYYLHPEELKAVDFLSSSEVLVFNQTHSNFAAGKTKLVAWFVSNCFTLNGRMWYARELAKHIPVDIYGTCGDRVCDRTNTECWNILDRDYKFYLAFENKNAVDYITEKFFLNGLRHNIVPIVMGAPKRSYQDASPHNSFIHVGDFQSPRQLASYLWQLHRNDSAYNEYLAWKRDGGAFVSTNFWCRLCALLNAPNSNRNVYAELNKWWQPNLQC